MSGAKWPGTQPGVGIPVAIKRSELREHVRSILDALGGPFFGSVDHGRQDYYSTLLRRIDDVSLPDNLTFLVYHCYLNLVQDPALRRENPRLVQGISMAFEDTLDTLRRDAFLPHPRRAGA